MIGKGGLHVMFDVVQYGNGQLLTSDANPY